MIPALLAGAGLGLGKYYLEDKPKEQRDRQTQAEIARYSPWSGMKPESVQSASMFGDVMQGGTMGMGMGQNLDAASGQQAMQQKQGGLIDAQTNYYNELAKNPGGYAKPQQVQPMQPITTSMNTGSGGSYGSKPSWMMMNQQNGMYA